MIPEDVVDRVREEADIISIIGEFVKLKRVGTSYRGPCPFHHGKNPNFSVTAKGGYKCFKCGESGDVFTFVQKHLGMDFVDAVKWVGEKTGVEVHYASPARVHEVLSQIFDAPEAIRTRALDELRKAGWEGLSQ